MASSPTKLDRRAFLSAAAGAGTIVGASGALTLPAAASPGDDSSGKLPAPSARQRASDSGELGALEGPFVDQPGSDFMVDAIKSLSIDYVGACAGSSFRGLHESIINHAGNRQPELLTCLHEEISVGLAHGYAKVAGKPMAVMAHGTVGLQHAAMAVYNAYCDQVPVIILAGNHFDATHRKNRIHWVHSAQDAALLLRDYSKWDDSPMSLGHFAESIVRGYQVATSPPMAPVVLVVDAELQEARRSVAAPTIPKLAVVPPPQGDSAAVEEAARWLVAAESPVLVAERLARTPEGMSRLVELAELLGAPVIDLRARMNFPTRHPLNLSENSRPLLASADVILGLEVIDFWGLVNAFPDTPQALPRSVVRENARLISIGIGPLAKANYQDFQRYAQVNVAIAGDAEATLPELITAVRRVMTRGQRSRVAERAKQIQATHVTMRETARREALFGWHAKPMSVPRLCAEIWKQLRNEDWALVNEDTFQGTWPHRLWNFEKHHQFIGGSGGAGLGYNAAAAVGAALAHRTHGRIVVNIQGDGDLMCVPGVLWSAAHHRIPLLTIMHNNRGYHQEVMHIQRMANRRQRGIDQTHIGCAIDSPPIDHAKLAESMGVWAMGPITEPDDFGPALARAISIVKQGTPALIDVLTQGR